jgi:hypothetical protein
MAVNYKIVANNGLFDVVEKKTGHVVHTHHFASEAKKIMKHLNLGGGFDGFSPNFLFNGPKSLLNKNSENM